ncbi:MAG: murein biosynthesis integral membrane protein MurJ [Rhodobacteraceae bacterium]|nr:murein biosynthesis integral membrane protein MurJ [Paracoccaceae bacterium]
MARPRLLSGFVTVGAWTLASRVLGFVRDIMIAAALGTGPVAEAFLIAFSLPNMFRRFFAEGTLNPAFVPMFAKKLENDDGALEFARDALSGLGFFLILFTIVAQIFMPVLVLAMASGFVADDRFDLTVLFGRIAFPYILFIAMAALLSGVLNATGRFMAAAAAPVLLNVLFIGAMSMAIWAGFDMGLTLACTVPVAGIAQMVLVWVAAARAGFKLVPRRPRMTPELKRLAVLAGPAALAGGVVQVNLLVGRQVASFFDGAIAWLSYADRLYQLPLGVVGIAIGVVLLPDLTRRLSAGDVEGGREVLSRAGELALALTIPASVALILVPGPLVSVLFERGAFTTDDSARTAIAVAIYGLGLPAFVLQKVLQPIYFARENTRTPFHFALVALVVNAALAIGLSVLIGSVLPQFGFVSAAIATSTAGWVMTLLLWRGAWRMGEEARFDRRFWSRFWRIVAASWMMGAVLYGVVIVIGPMFGAGAFRYLALAILMAAGIGSYFGLGHLLRAFRISEFKSAMRR